MEKYHKKPGDIDETDLSPLTVAEFAISQIDERNRDYYESNKQFLDELLVRDKGTAASADGAAKLEM